MRGRVYDPLASRFTTADPLMQAPYWSQGMNRYAYVFNDPLNATDPSGFLSMSDVVKGFVYAGHIASAGLFAAGSITNGSAATTNFAAVGGPAGGSSWATLPGLQGQASSGPAVVDGYRTPWEAARGALERYNPASISSKDPNDVLSYGDEYGGLIYEQGGRYHYTEAVVGEEQGHVDPWGALDKVPEDARNRIVGDYHTHGGPNPIADGEDFSGLHYGIGSSSPSLTAGTDIVEARNDLTKYKDNILNPSRYTSYLGTPSGRFGVYNPSAGTVISFSPNARLLPPDTQIPASSYAWH